MIQTPDDPRCGRLAIAQARDYYRLPRDGARNLTPNWGLTASPSSGIHKIAPTPRCDARVMVIALGCGGSDLHGSHRLA